MSAGNFVTSRYRASYASPIQIHPIRVQPETLLAEIDGLANAATTDAINNPIVAAATGSRRSNGLKARRVRLQLPVGTTPPAGYRANGITTIPALQPAFFALATKGAVCRYLGVDWVVVGRVAESPTA